MSLARPVFTRQEAEALAAAARHTLKEPGSAVRALGANPEVIEHALRALDKLQQHTRSANRK